MGKIGDLWVKLGLKSDDYKKGMDDAKKETEGFKGSLGKMKAGALAVWAAIGTAVTKFAKDLVTSTNRMSDAWNTFTSQSKAAWNTFLSAISAWDFSNFFSRMREATAQAAEFAKAMDMGFEVNNSIALQRAAMSDELAALKITMQDATKPYEVRIKAAEDYLAKVKPLYDQIEAEAKRVEDAHLGKWLAGTGLGDNEQVRADLRKFLVAIGKDQELASMLTTLVTGPTVASLTNKLTSAYTNKKDIPAIQQQIDDINAMYAAVAAKAQELGFETSLTSLMRVYNNMRGDKDTAPLVQAMVDALNAAGLYDRETQEIQSVMNGLVNQQTTQALQEAAKLITPEENIDDIIANIEDLKQIEDIELEAPEIDLSALDAAEDKLKAFVDEWRAEQERIAALNQMFEDSTVSALSGGLQAFTDMLFGLEGANASQILAALLQPFADTAIQLGEMLLAQGIAVTAFKESLNKLQGGPAIAAGLSLIAIGSAMRSGIQALAGRGSASTASVGDAGSSAATPYMTELTIYVEGRLDGGDIVLSGKKTTDAWGR